jgi:Tfp pilus assembly protein PilF
MKAFRRGWLVILLSLFVLPSTLQSQNPRVGTTAQAPMGQGMPNPSPNGIGGVNGLSSIKVTVTDDNGQPLDQQALVKLYAQETNAAAWGTTQDRGIAEFDQIVPGNYQIEASAAGFATATETLEVGSYNHTYLLTVRLKLDSDSSVQPTKPGQVLAPKARKETEKGLASLQSGNWSDAEKHLMNAFRLAPTNADVAFLIGYMYQQKKDEANAKVYFEKATSFNPQHVRALTSLGQLLLDEHDYEGATEPLEKAVETDPHYWQSHSVLASAYLHDNQLEKSREQAELAIQTGKGAAKNAELILGDALAGLGRSKEAVAAYQGYLDANPNGAAVATIREAIAKLRAPPKADPASQPVAIGGVATSTAPNLASNASADAKVSLPSWGPPNIDDYQPVVVNGMQCPADHVIEKTGERVKELVDHLANFDATEEVVHESLDELGHPTSKDARKFDYTASISEPKPDVLKVEEYRNSKTDNGSFPGGIATHGLPALAFVFHPDMRNEFDLVCEGLGSWKGEATWLVHFRQRSDQPSHLQSFDFTNASFAVDMKGRAWISASNYQILRLEADLVSPLRNIQLLTEHQIVEYQPVKFTKANTTVWLPADADIYMDFRRQRFHLRHSFSHYMLFSVGASQKISQPKMPDTTQEAPKQPN